MKFIKKIEGKKEKLPKKLKFGDWSIPKTKAIALSNFSFSISTYTQILSDNWLPIVSGVDQYPNMSERRL